MVTTPRSRDKRLLKAIRAGDVDAFETLYRWYAPGLLGYIMQRVPNRMEAEELLQETFLHMLKDRRFQPTRAGLGTYLYTIARNLCISHHRRQSSHPVAPFEGVPDAPTRPLWGDAYPRPDDATGVQEVRRALERALDLLPDAQREAFLLRHRHGLGYREIAQVCRCPVGTAKSRVHLALTALRVSLDALPDNVTPIAPERERHGVRRGRSRS